MRCHKWKGVLIPVCMNVVHSNDIRDCCCPPPLPEESEESEHKYLENRIAELEQRCENLVRRLNDHIQEDE